MKTPKARYEIGTDKIGVICFAKSLYDACYEARHWVIKHGRTVEIYDRMAHPGRPELWEVKQEGIEIRLHVKRTREVQS